MKKKYSLSLEQFLETSFNNGEGLVPKNIDFNYINVIPGSFSPFFHKGHLKLANKLYKKNKKPVVLATTESNRYNIDIDTKKEILENIKKEYPFIKDIVFCKNGYIGNINDEFLKKNYKIDTIGVGSDRYDNYKKQLDKYNLDKKEKIKLIGVNRYDDNISGTLLLDMLNNNKDISEYIPNSSKNFIDKIRNLIKK